MTRSEPKTLDHVVVGVDFSAPADAALEWALMVARAHGAVVHVVNGMIRNLPLVDRLETYSPLAEISAKHEEERLEELARRLRSPDQPIEFHLLHDRPSVAVLQVAARFQAGLIVLGTRGEGGFRHLRLGSTTERVTQRATCAALTVSPESRPATSWPDRILVATDFSPEADAALRSVGDILIPSDGSADILFLTVLHMPGGLEGNAEVTSLWQSYTAECRQLLKERMESLGASIDAKRHSMQVLLREGIPAEQIVRVATEEEVDLIALASRGTFAAGRSFLGSVTKRVIQTAPCPTLTVPSHLPHRTRSGARG